MDANKNCSPNTESDKVIAFAGNIENNARIPTKDTSLTPRPAKLIGKN
jgi:hypothetical protein